MMVSSFPSSRDPPLYLLHPVLRMRLTGCEHDCYVPPITSVVKWAIKLRLAICQQRPETGFLKKHFSAGIIFARLSLRDMLGSRWFLEILKTSPSDMGYLA